MRSMITWALRHEQAIYALLLLLLVGGIAAFFNLGKKEDALFVIKSAALECHYPGATPEEVEALITEPIERALQSMPALHKLTSKSYYGRCQLLVELDPATPSREIPQRWDELRRRVLDIAPHLPEGASAIEVQDDYGALYGLYYALVADPGFEPEELRRYARDFKLRLQEIEGVERVSLMGEREPAIGVYLTASELAGFSIRPEMIVETILRQNRLLESATSRGGELRILIPEEGTYRSLEELRDQLLMASDGKQYRLGDIARIEREYLSPPSSLVRVNGLTAIAIGISTSAQSDVVKVGQRVEERLSELLHEAPIGLSVEALYPEDRIAREATNDFLINLLESLLIVVALIMLIMGWRAGILVGSSLLFSIGGTLLLMQPLGESLNRTSLAGFIIAMGMLVDNAIVVVDLAQREMRSGVELRESLRRGASRSAFPLLGATAIAILSLLPLQLAPSSVAEIIKPLFVVMALSLLLSWLLAMVQTPLCGARILLPLPSVKDSSNGFQHSIERIASALIRQRRATLGGAFILFGVALWGFGKLPQDFFPSLSKPYFRAEVLLPEGYDIEATHERLQAMQRWLDRQKEVKRNSYTAGGTPPRYYLASAGISHRPNYGNLLVELHHKAQSGVVEERFARYVEDSLPDVWLRSSLFRLSPVPDATIEFGFIGPNIDTLLRLATEAEQVMRRHDACRNIRLSAGNRIPLWQPLYSQMKGQRIGISRSQLLDGILRATDGYPLGSYREGDRVMPILLKSHTGEGEALSSLIAQPLFSPSGKVYSIGQAVDGFRLSFQRGVIEHHNRQRLVKAQCDPRREANTRELLGELKASIDQIPLPEGYRMQLFGEEESRAESNAALGRYLPLTLQLIIFLLLLLFNDWREVVITLGSLPLVLIGVVAALALLGKAFNFFALLGLIGLVGMQIKNSIVLLEEIGRLRREGVSPYQATLRATKERAIPLIAASFTTILGMIPLLFDALFGAMAATIMGGLLVSTLLSLGLLPVAYTLLHRVKP